MTIHIVGQFSIASDNLAKFRKFVADSTAIVRQKEQGATLAYDFFADESDRSRFLIHEAFADGDALAVHIKNLGTLLAIAHEIFENERTIIIGDLPKATVEQFKSMNFLYHSYREPVSVL